MKVCTCGDPEDAHTATCLTPVYSTKACQYARDSDNPCWCYKFNPVPEVGQVLLEKEVTK